MLRHAQACALRHQKLSRDVDKNMRENFYTQLFSISIGIQNSLKRCHKNLYKCTKKKKKNKLKFLIKHFNFKIVKCFYDIFQYNIG